MLLLVRCLDQVHNARCNGKDITDMLRCHVTIYQEFPGQGQQPLQHIVVTPFVIAPFPVYVKVPSCLLLLKSPLEAIYHEFGWHRENSTHMVES